jgi:hypothetical protein
MSKRRHRLSHGAQGATKFRIGRASSEYRLHVDLQVTRGAALNLRPFLPETADTLSANFYVLGMFR